MAETEIPPLYDEERGLREVARARLKRGKLTRHQVVIADSLAEHMQQHFSAEEIETAGRALLIGTASCGAREREGIQASVILNILGFAAGRMVTDGRAGLDAQAGEDGSVDDR